MSAQPHSEIPLRTELFSDAVFAIALTLLALDLTVSGYDPGKLGDSLVARWPAYIAFLGSFLFIAVMWLNHHAAFQRVKATPQVFLWANFGVLLGAVVLPFPTRVLAEALQNPRGDDVAIAVLVYAGIATVIGFLRTIFWLVILRDPRVWSSPDDGPLWSAALRRSIPGALDGGASALLQPGGSIRDDEVIAAANERGTAMVFTGERHFRH